MKRKKKKVSGQQTAAAAENPKKKKKSSFWRKLFPRREKGDMVILVCCLILLGMSILMAGSLANNLAFTSYPKAVMNVVSQVAFAVMFLVVYFIVDRVFSFKFMKVFGILLLCFYLVLMVLVQAAGVDKLGAKSWLSIGGFSLQPSELFKPLIIALCAWMVHTFAKRRKDTEPGFKNMLRITWLPLLSLLASCVLLALQKDFGTMVIIVGISLVCFLIPSMPCLKVWQSWAKWLAVGGVAALAFLFFITDIGTDILASIDYTTHIAVRIENTKNPYQDVMGEGFQTATGLYAIADGGVTGRGYGNSERKYGFLTQAESDFILSIIVEELGLIGLLVVTLCNMLLSWRLFGYALRARDQGDKVILGGVGAHFLLHFIVNVGGIGGLIPLTGVPLLLVSSGGTSVLACAVSIGMAQSSIRRVKAQVKEKKIIKAAVKDQEEEFVMNEQQIPALPEHSALKGAA